MIGTAGRTTFDSFNNYILKGDAAQGLEYLFDSLMTRALDEPDAVYGLVASSAEVAPDKMSVVFKMRPEAKFADGTPVTADDVVFSFNTSEGEGSPQLHAVAARCGESGGARPAHGALRVQGRPDPRSAARRRRAAHPVEGVLHDAPVRSDVAREAARLRPLRDRRLQARHVRQLQAPPRLLGQGSPGQPRPLQFRRAALRVLSRPHAGARGPEGRARSTSARSSPPSTGRRATTSPP